MIEIDKTVDTGATSSVCRTKYSSERDDSKNIATTWVLFAQSRKGNNNNNKQHHELPRQQHLCPALPHCR